MIKKISISNIATFKDSVEVNPRRINYIYGGNGSGKTTVSRLINDSSISNYSSIEWENDQLETVVYNQDFIKKNFEQDKIKGIFTLGKDIPETEKQIQEKNKEKDKIEKHIIGLVKTIENKEYERQEIINSAVDDCWNYKQKYANRIKNSLAGKIGKKNDFFTKCIEEQNNNKKLLTIHELETKNNALYNRELVNIDVISNIELSSIQNIEKAPIFKESIIGNTDSVVGDLIAHLNNSDWVNKGLQYLENTKDKKCPFCQQKIDEQLSETINDFFDNTYLVKTESLTTAITRYKSYISNLFTQIDEIVKQDIEVYDLTEVKNVLELSKTIYDKNLVLLNDKNDNKSISIELTSLENNLTNIQHELNKCIKAINDHNSLVSNIQNEKNELKSLCWKFMSTETKTIISRYIDNIQKVDTVLEKLNKLVSDDKIRQAEVNNEISSLESQITSVEHSVNEINRILKGFHFTGFHLKEANEKGHYQIVRDDGSLANNTLSEGEYTFITFLYFFYLIRGSITETGVTSKKVVVIDDPISSLDSGVLFIVSNLVKSIIDDILSNYRQSKIRQLFILTHNIYFHKEVSFKGNRKNNSNNEFFWLIYKTDNISDIKTSTKNPINTTYAILWDEIKNAATTNKITVFNNLRRILEYYFKIIGDYNYEEIVNKFEFEDQQTCKALISWINDGSHFINDDLLVETEIESVDRYLKIFKDIFDKLGHISHYNMMVNRK